MPPSAPVCRTRAPHRTTSLAWNGMDDSERPVANGVYFYLLRIRDKTVTKRMVLID